ncbi:hypothetical protein GTQ48_12395 [Alteromonas genovensis]|uniref:DUF3570 domain-containing protein n=1 Tax=Alteromonas genovensis TaxID=471225 RepID=A0A6N9TLA7_9ALTE|nr:hypothetical protein [Alteromonas genovensis]NDW16319.1 hypothetical protein [Alteromonas genovensis]
MTCAVTVLCHLMLVNFSPLQTNIETAKRNVDAVSNHEQSQSSASLQTHQSNEANDVHEHHFDEQWFDIWQRSFTDSMDFTVKQFDGWFHSGDSGAKQLGEQAHAEGRIQLAWEPRSEDFADTDLRFRIRVKLPALEERVDLLLSDNEDETQDSSIRAARDTADNNRDQTTIALRFRPDQNSHYSFRVGAGRRDQLYTRARYRDALAFTNKLAMLYDAELYYFTRDRLGAEIGAAFQYDISPRHLVRQNNRFFYRDETNDWFWRHEIQHLYSINNHNALIPHLMVEGLSQPNYRVEEVYGGLRWRSNTIRDWLYFDVEPFVLLLREDNFSASLGVALRVEAYYGGNSGN